MFAGCLQRVYRQTATIFAGCLQHVYRRTAGMKNRDRVKVATGGHWAGIVVPYDKKTEVRGSLGQTTVH